MTDLIWLAIALSMDSFAVSIGLGAKQPARFLKSCIYTGLYFGTFHAIMPFIGYVGGRNLFSWFESGSKWISFGLLVAIGVKTILDSCKFNDLELEGSSGQSHGLDHKLPSHMTMLMLALAVSIDALAAGFTLVLFPVDPIIACLTIAIITIIFSISGMLLGRKGGHHLKQKANLFGGAILIIIGFKMLLF